MKEKDRNDIILLLEKGLQEFARMIGSDELKKWKAKLRHRAAIEQERDQKFGLKAEKEHINKIRTGLCEPNEFHPIDELKEFYRNARSARTRKISQTFSQHEKPHFEKIVSKVSARLLYLRAAAFEAESKFFAGFEIELDGPGAIAPKIDVHLNSLNHLAEDSKQDSPSGRGNWREPVRKIVGAEFANAFKPEKVQNTKQPA